MRSLKALCLSVLGLCALAGVLAGAVSALPSILFLAMETVPVKIMGENATVLTALESESAPLTGSGLKLELEFASAAEPLGPYTATFSGVKSGVKRCKSGTEAAGTVVVRDEAHLVFDTLGNSLGQAGIAALLLVGEFEILCEGANFKVAGSVLALLKPVNKEVLMTESFESILRCNPAAPTVPLERNYWNEAGTKSIARLLAKPNGGPFEEACVNVATNLNLKPNKMLEIMT